MGPLLLQQDLRFFYLVTRLRIKFVLGLAAELGHGHFWSAEEIDTDHTEKLSHGLVGFEKIEPGCGHSCFCLLLAVH